MQHTDLSVWLGESLATSATTPPSDAQLIAWARDQANRIVNTRGAGEAAKALEFLKTHGGANSQFYEAATRVAAAIIDYPNSPVADDSRSPLATVLTSWADFQESGIAAAPPFGVAARVEAADDLVDQASQLLGETDYAPPAAVMLAGAAIEEFLRGQWETTTQPLAGKPGIASYGEALRKAGLLDKGDVKELIAIADVRNDAAHGDFNKVDEARAKLLVDRVTFFLQKHRPT